MHRQTAKEILPSRARFEGVLLLVVAVLALGRPCPVSADAFDLERVSWSKLIFRASKFGMGVTTGFELDTVAAGRVAGSLITPGQGTAIDAAVAELTTIRVSSKLGGRSSELELWMNPDGGTLQRTQSEEGRKQKHFRHRTNRFTDSGVFSVVRRPDRGETELPVQQWSESSEHFYAFPERTRLNAVTEPSVLLYAASATLAKPGDKSSIFVFTKGSVMRVTLRADGLQRLKVDYQLEGDGPGRRVRGAVQALRVRVEGEPADPSGDQGAFEFLGLRRDVELFLDPETRVPLQVSGRVPLAGRVNIRLQSALLR